jgi:hypothetical protein
MDINKLKSTIGGIVLIFVIAVIVLWVLKMLIPILITIGLFVLVGFGIWWLWKNVKISKS